MTVFGQVGGLPPDIGMIPFAGLIHPRRSPLVIREVVPRGRDRQALSDISSKSKPYIRRNLKSAPREKHVASMFGNRCLFETCYVHLFENVV